jgi:hypothetical protein
MSASIIRFPSERRGRTATSLTLPPLEATRLRHLAREIHALGEHPLFELFAEIVGGADPMERIERYARLEREHGDFIRALGGDKFSSQLLLVGGAK